MNTSFPPPKYPQNTSPPFLGGAFWGAGGRAWALPSLAGSVTSQPVGLAFRGQADDAVIQMKQHFYYCRR